MVGESSFWGSKMNKKILVAVVTIGLEVFVSLLIAMKSGMSFIESAFFVGIFSTFSLYFLNSEGGLTTDILDVNIQGSTGMKMKRQDFVFKRGIAFTSSLAFLIIMGIAVWIKFYL
ncbi:MAG: hypothetical protein K0R71_2224 [Bacillales bacterium]|nr:hypothetical protein [Bacillales bacterium]